MYQTPFNEGRIPYMYNGEFASIYNFGPVPVDISDWRIVSDGQRQEFTFPGGSIMQPGARFFVAHSSRHMSFVLGDLFDGFQLGSNDRIFYEQNIIHTNSGENLRLYRACGTRQDILTYDGSRGSQPRLEAPNTNACRYNGRECRSIQRHNIRVVDDVIIFNVSDWQGSTRVALEHFPTIPLTLNGRDIIIPTIFVHDASGNRIGRHTIILSSPQSAPRRASAFAGNPDAENDYFSNEEDLEISDNFFTDKLNESDVVIFPNPTRGALAVEIRNMNSEIPHQITVFNLNGSIVFQKNDIGNFTEIDLSIQPRGVYLLRISSPDSFITWRIIKE